MNVILKVILAVYKFFVGDLVILIGVTLTMVILALINSVGALAPLRGGLGTIMIVGVLATLLATLGREVMRSDLTPPFRKKVADHGHPHQHPPQEEVDHGLQQNRPNSGSADLFGGLCPLGRRNQQVKSAGRVQDPGSGRTDPHGEGPLPRRRRAHPGPLP